MREAGYMVVCLPSAHGTQQSLESLSEANELDSNEDNKAEYEVSGEEDDTEEVDEDQDNSDHDTDENDDELEDDFDIDGDADVSDEDKDDDEELNESVNDSENECSDQDEGSNEEDKPKDSRSKVQKRKLSAYIGQLNAADASLRALKRCAGAKKAEKLVKFSDEDFKRIKELKAKKEAKLALAQHGLSKGGDTKSVTFKIPSSDQLSMKRVDPSQLEVHIKRKLTKEERLELMKAGREDRGKYQARTAVKQKRTGGLSNRQKQHKKRALAASRANAARSRQQKKKQQKRSGKQFRGKKAWK